MGVAESALEIENARAGKFLPKSRYWLGYILVGVAWISGGVASNLDIPFWAKTLMIALFFGAYIAIFSKYRKRSIT